MHCAMSEIPLSEKLLVDAGGWAAIKEARSILAAGRVTEAGYTPPNLLGRVRGSETEYRAGLRILSKTNIENTCTCIDSRRRGLICAHSLAVGLAVLKGGVAPATVPGAPAKTDAPKATQPGPFSTDEGEPCVLHLILPPNFLAAWERGAVMVVAEAEIGGTRKPLSNLNPGRKYRVDARDATLGRKLVSMASGKLPGMVTCKPPEFLELLDAALEHPRMTFGKGQRVEMSGRGHLPTLIAERGAQGALRLKVQKIEGLLADGQASAWRFTGKGFEPVAPGLPVAYRRLLVEPVTVPAPAADGFLQNELPGLAQYFTIQTDEAIQSTTPAQSIKPNFAAQIEGSLNFLTARVEAVYGDRRVMLDSGGAALARFARNRQEENAALQRLRSFGFSGPDGKGEMVLKGESRTLAFFAQGLQALQREWKVTIGERFQHVTRNVERVEPKLEIVHSGEQWFDLRYELATPGGDRFSGAEITRLLQAGQSHVKRSNGSVAVFDPALLNEFEQLLRDSDPKQMQAGIYRLDRRQAGTLDAFTSDNAVAVGGSPDWRDWVTKSHELDKLQPVPLGTLESVLRIYQKHGVYWLNFLAKNGLAGILADEMGLGKTVQTLAFLRTLKGRGPSLIVCPSSLIFNWRAEAEHWTPDLKVLALEGASRASRFPQIGHADLVITSYPLLQRDLASYGSQEFAAAILDEAQRIKNPDTQTAKTAMSIRARHRFALTGTPVENSVRDLWSVMNFLLPGYLGSRNDFRDRFEKPIQTDPSGPETQRLKRRIKPFILRRLKRTVATELPDKLEQVSYCEMTDTQRALYRKITESTRRQISELAGAKDAAKARMTMLTALLRLRQAACDLRLLGLEEAPSADEASAKLELLRELIEEAAEGEHRVLVFSQFVKMLSLVRESLEADAIDYCYLDGQSKDRPAQVQRFQTGQVPVFLISLKAGGTGLNLTAADTVIHFDPWWNPAVEAQATDRAHRIGQTKIVTSYKLITRDTVEEKILNLQAKKQAIASSAVEDEQPLMEGLSMDDIRELLE
jgi:superfamily II DNA or RNA helicase